jgi:hypothetical protein
MQGIKFLISFNLFYSTAIAFFVAPVVAPNLAAADPRPNFVLCRNQKNVRTVNIEMDPSGQRCIAKYSKDGVAKEVGRGLNYESCIKVMENIKVNLEKSNWKCKEITNEIITSTAPAAPSAPDKK